MLYLAIGGAAVSAGVGVFLITLMLPVNSWSLRHRMAELGLDASTEAAGRSRRQRQRQRFEQLIKVVGERFQDAGADTGPLRNKLRHAGFREPSAVVFFLGLRVVATAGLCAIAVFLGVLGDYSGLLLVVAAVWGAATGWFVPRFLVSSRASSRQKEIQLALPDALDLLVICVEAGLGLNQALVRVAGEIRHVSELLAEELALTNFQIRAGSPREDALKDLANRTGVSDVRTLVTTMIQTERFGTSIAQSLRVHADTLRLKRKQRAEEAAAKTTIKMIFPLALCVFPALFVVVLGPALIQIYTTLSGL